MVRLMLTGILLVLLTACGTSSIEPSNKLVQLALELQLEQTQQQLSEKLGLNIKGFEINHLAIAQKEPLVIQNLPTYHIQGTYDLTMKLPKRQITPQHNPFDIYLQRQQEGKTWRLAVPKYTGNDQPTWFTYLIQ